jgi:hypothetical protein
MSIKSFFSLGVLVMTAAVGAAQAGVQAEFHLPFEAHWGNMTLAPGDYKISLPASSLDGRQFFVSTEGKSGYVLPLVADVNDTPIPGSERGSLELVKVDGKLFVKRYRSIATGKTYSFIVPKLRHHLDMADQDVVTVGVSGK